MKVLIIYDKGCNLPYFLNVIEVLKSEYKYDVTLCNLDAFLNLSTNVYYDVIFYQTFPDDRLFPIDYMKQKLKCKKKKQCINLHFDEINYNPVYPLNSSTHMYNFKFDSKKIAKTDKHFLCINAKLKVLVDLHADSDQDGYTRFSNKDHPMYNILSKEYIKFYRIKNVSSISYYTKYNVLLSTCYNVQNVICNSPNTRNITFHYSMSLNNDFRVKLKETLKSSSFDINYNNFENYPIALYDVFVEICAHGYGKGCIRDITALAHGCLVLLHESLKHVFVLPNKLLFDNVECIYYNFENIHEKLEYIQNNKEKSKEIALNGKKAFDAYYNYTKSAKELVENIEKITNN